MYPAQIANPYLLTGLAPSAATLRAAVAGGLNGAVHTDPLGPLPKAFSTDSPMLWLAVTIAVAVGAAGVAGSVRVGSLRAGASAGTT